MANRRAIFDHTMQCNEAKNDHKYTSARSKLTSKVTLGEETLNRQSRLCVCSCD